jgi:hypothetical protein
MSGNPKRAGNRRYTYKRDAIKRGLEFDLDIEECRKLFQSNCFYCETPACDGIDRLSPQLGYNKNNIAPCCLKCNFILADLPEEAKKILAKSLKEIRINNLLNEWEPASIRASKEYNRNKNRKIL